MAERLLSALLVTTAWSFDQTLGPYSSVIKSKKKRAGVQGDENGGEEMFKKKKVLYI